MSLPTQAAVKRMIEAVTKAGLEVGTVDIAADGTIKLHQKAETKTQKPKGPVEWE